MAAYVAQSRLDSEGMEGLVESARRETVEMFKGHAVLLVLAEQGEQDDHGPTAHLQVQGGYGESGVAAQAHLLVCLQPLTCST